MATVRFRGGNRNGRPARCALLPASGLEIVHQEAAENRDSVLGGKLFRIWPAICAAILAVGAPIGGELDAFEARAETAGRDPERNGFPASGVSPVWLMFLQHRMRCVSTIRWRASLTILAGVVLIAAEGRAS
jgi:hypothetical protein